MTTSGAVVLTGGTGLVGGALLPILLGRGCEVRALVRRGGRLTGARELVWDGTTPPAGALDGAQALVHLSGEPVFGGLPTAARRLRLRASRVDSTRALVAALAALPEARRPRAFVCASAVGYYGDRGEEILDESAEPGDGFLADLCVDWEAAAAEASRHGVRVCSVRIGVVLSRKGGALPLMARPFRLGLGGRLGSGRQWFPWVGLDDLVALLAAALDDERCSGAVNGVAPEPARNEELTRALGRVLGRPTLLPVPAFAVRAALGDLSAELLGSKRVVPRRARELGFAFRQTSLEELLRSELA
jgi:uncharacterized protein (TIGR01777 family)